MDSKDLLRKLLAIFMAGKDKDNKTYGTVGKRVIQAQIEEYLRENSTEESIRHCIVRLLECIGKEDFNN